MKHATLQWVWIILLTIAAAACGGKTTDNAPETVPVPAPTVDPPLPVIAPTVRVEELERYNTVHVYGGSDIWFQFARYGVSAGEPARLTHIAIEVGAGPGLTADPADISAIAIWSGSVDYPDEESIRGQTLVPAGAGRVTDIDLSKNPIRIPAKGGVDFQVWAKITAVRPWSVPGSVGLCRSGHAPALGIASNGKLLNMRIVAADGTPRTAATGAPFGNPMIVRQAEPVVIGNEAEASLLANDDQDLIVFYVGADPNKRIAWKQVTFVVKKTSDVSLTNFRMRNGDADMDPSTYAIIDAKDGRDLMKGLMPRDTNNATIVVSLAEGKEEVVGKSVDSGKRYALRATVAGAAPGQSVTTSFTPAAKPVVVTGTLARTNVFTVVSGGETYPGSFVWSDLSDEPHSPLTGVSRDWSHGSYVRNLDWSWTLKL